MHVGAKAMKSTPKSKLCFLEAFLFCGGMCICMFFFYVLFYDVTNEEDRMLLINYGGDPIPYL
jgi:hypothetical protein